MLCEKSFIPMKLHWHNYLIFSLGSCVHEICTKIGLNTPSTLKRLDVEDIDTVFKAYA
jgi:hypothetical protein